MAELRCEICGREAEGICPRCYRAVCGECVDPVTLDCIDCSRTKRVIEEDYLRYVDTISRRLDYIESKLNDCFYCPIMKDALMAYLRRLRELGSFSKLESLEELHERVKEVEEKAKQLAVNYLVRLKMAKL